MPRSSDLSLTSKTGRPCRESKATRQRSICVQRLAEASTVRTCKTLLVAGIAVLETQGITAVYHGKCTGDHPSRRWGFFLMMNRRFVFYDMIDSSMYLLTRQCSGQTQSVNFPPSSSFLVYSMQCSCRKVKSTPTPTPAGKNIPQVRFKHGCSVFAYPPYVSLTQKVQKPSTKRPRSICCRQ